MSVSNEQELSAEASGSGTYHHGNLRETLLELARKHLEDSGPDKLSLRALAREAGVSQTAPYRHFADKQGLLAALAAQGYLELTRLTLAAQKAGMETSERLFTAGLAYIRFASDHPALYKLMFGPVIGQPMQFPELKRAGELSFQVILDIVRDGVREGTFDSNSPEELIAMTCWSTVHGISSLSIDGMFGCVDTNIPDTTLIEGTLRLSLQGLLART